MSPCSWGSFSMNLYVFLITLISIYPCQSTDVFCGQLTIYKQQWFAKETQTLGARTSTDLKDCLNFCCGIPDCQAVTFMGFLNNSPQPISNCVMFQCGPGPQDCRTVANPIATDGVVSVVIKREVPTPAQLQSRDEAIVDILNASTSENQTLATPPLLNVTSAPKEENTPAPTVVFDEGDEGGDADDSSSLNIAEQNRSSTVNGSRSDGRPSNTIDAKPNISKPRGGFKTTTSVTLPTTTTQSPSFLAGLAPVWVVGLLIVIAVVCCGIVLVLLSIYCCVRRSRTKMRSQPITSLKTPTLHAFNPTTANLNTTSTMA